MNDNKEQEVNEYQNLISLLDNLQNSTGNETEWGMGFYT